MQQQKPCKRPWPKLRRTKPGASTTPGSTTTLGKKKPCKRPPKQRKDLPLLSSYSERKGKSTFQSKARWLQKKTSRKQKSGKQKKKCCRNSVMKNSRDTWPVGGWCGEMTLPHGIATNIVTPKNTKKNSECGQEEAVGGRPGIWAHRTRRGKLLWFVQPSHGLARGCLGIFGQPWKRLCPCKRQRQRKGS